MSKLNHLKILLWNDDDKELEKWNSSILLYDDSVEIILSNSIDVNLVTEIFLKIKPDIVILDIMSPDDKHKGIAISEAIRKRDLLVPIIAVTREPISVYGAPDRAVKLGLSGIYQSTIMDPNIFDLIALRPSLNYWHSVAPEYPLVRKCIHLLRSKLGNCDFTDELISIIEKLPFTGTTDSWHNQVCHPLKNLIANQGHDLLANRFEKLTLLFEKADPFYMAASRSRRHLSHNVQVFLLGLAILLGCESIGEFAEKEIKKLRDGINSSEALIDVIILWICIANTHDSAYFSENFNKLKDNISALADSFTQVINPKIKPKSLHIDDWPELSHGDVASDLWLIDFPDGYQKEYTSIIAKAIALHDPKHTADKPVPISNWSSFLLIMADELQDWGRERIETAPGGIPFKTKTWGMFCLEGIIISEESKQWCIDLTFVAQDYPEVIGEHYGIDGTQTVKDTFIDILNNIKNNLRSDNQIKLIVTILFTSRIHENPFRKQTSIS